MKIFVLLYKEMSIAVNLLSTYSKHTLMNLCQENIKVRPWSLQDYTCILYILSK